MLHWLSAQGTCAIVEFPGVLYRGGAEQKIRKYLIDNNFVDCVIQLPADLFFGVTIATCIIVLKKNKTDNNVLFIDATNEFVRKDIKNKLTEANIDKILSSFVSKENIENFSYLASYEEVVKNEYNISVNKYVKVADEKEEIDIKALNEKIDGIVERQTSLRNSLKEIITKLDKE